MSSQCLYSSVCFYRKCVWVSRVACVWVMVGWPSQAHELALIHAGAYSMFTHGTVYVCTPVWLYVCWCKGVCIFAMTHNVFFLFLQKKRGGWSVSQLGAPLLGWPAVPQGLWLRVWPGERSRSVTMHHPWRICLCMCVFVCAFSLISLPSCLLMYWLMMFPERHRWRRGVGGRFMTVTTYCRGREKECMLSHAKPKDNVLFAFLWAITTTNNVFVTDHKVE